MSIPITIMLLAYISRALAIIVPFPLKDDRGPYRVFPYMTVGLVVLNTIIHLFLNLLPLWIEIDENVLKVFLQMLLVPADILEGRGLGALSMITSAFLHINWSHLTGNMFFLLFFGRKLEDVLGPAKFGLFYLTCALVAGTGSVLGRAALPATRGLAPGLGASGAVMGVMAAYLFLYPNQRIRTLPVLFGFIPIPFSLPMPAWVFIVYKVIGDVVNGLLRQELEAIGYVASFVDSFAHLGGVIAGLTCLFLFLPSEILHYRHRPDEAP